MGGVRLGRLARREGPPAEHRGAAPARHQWADAQLRLRFHLGQAISLTPFFQARYSRLLDEDGFDSSKEFFFGGGAELYWHWSDSLSLHSWYSFVDNDNRPSIRVDGDVRGEHMFHLGMVLRFGATRR